MDVLSLSPLELKDLMDISSFIFEQAGYVQVSNGVCSWCLCG